MITLLNREQMKISRLTLCDTEITYVVQGHDNGTAQIIFHSLWWRLLFLCRCRCCSFRMCELSKLWWNEWTRSSNFRFITNKARRWVSVEMKIAIVVFMSSRSYSVAVPMGIWMRCDSHSLRFLRNKTAVDENILCVRFNFILFFSVCSLSHTPSVSFGR